MANTVVQQDNDNLILIVGESSGGKSASLQYLENPEGVLYLNCEANKKLPFPTKFAQLSIADPYHVPTYFETMESKAKCHTIVIDTLTFLMDMFESVHVIPASDTQAAWGAYAQYFKNLMQNQVAKATKNVIFCAHVQSILNNENMTMERRVPVKGQLMKNGIEAWFSTIVSARTIAVDKLAPYSNPLLNITKENEEDGFKYVYQTRLTKETVHDRIRSPMGMWSRAETFIDNNAQYLLNRLHEYYV